MKTWHQERAEIERRAGRIATLIIVVVVIVGLGLFVAIKYWYGSTVCAEKAQSFEDNKWGWFSGCMVKHKGRWLPLENIRGFDDK